MHKKKHSSLKSNSISAVPCFVQMSSHHQSYIPKLVYTQLIFGEENKLSAMYNCAILYVCNSFSFYSWQALCEFLKAG